MGRVYRGEHVGLGRTSAVKVLSPGLVARQPLTVERFWAEARAVAGLVHPHVVTVHNLGSDRGYHYIEMEYVPGGVSLKETLVHEGAFEALRATALVRQVAMALGRRAPQRTGPSRREAGQRPAHGRGPGQARRFRARPPPGRPRGGHESGRHADIHGARAVPGAPASPSTDLYAVGVMYFYLLTARLPFSSDNLGHLIRLHRMAPVPDIRRLAPAVPDEVPPILARLLHKDPAKRYDSAEELADDLKLILGHLRDTEGLVRESLEGLDCLVQGAKDNFRVIVPVPGDRIQEVYIELTQGRKNERLLQIYSVCATPTRATSSSRSG